MAVLWVVVVLTVVAAIVARGTRLDGRICVGNVEHIRGRWAGRAGLEYAVSLLQDDGRAYDGFGDMWSTGKRDEGVDSMMLDEEEDDAIIEVAIGRNVCTLEIVDEACKLNINTATKEQLLCLPEMEEEIVGAIIDWRDEDDDESQGGAEGGYYLNLEYGYEIRNGPFRTVRELFMVKGVTRELMYGEDSNLNGVLDLNECDGELNKPLDNGDDVLDEGLLAYVTVYSYDSNKDAQGNDRVNISKADENKLTKELGISKSHAKWIVENRKKDGYKSIADLINEKSKKKPDKNSKNDKSDKAKELDLETFKGIVDKITVKEEDRVDGRVNVNTAGTVVLSVLLGGNEELAEAVVDHCDKVGSIMSIGELLDVKGMKIKVFKDIAELVTTRSSVFSVRSETVSGYTGGVSSIECVVDRGGNDGVSGLFWYEGAGH